MGGLFGVVAKQDCVSDVFYGTDYHSHLGTRRGGLAFTAGQGFTRSIHSIENSYFRTKFEPDLTKFKGHMGIGVISDADAQPLVIGSHLGPFALVTVAKINNLAELAAKAFSRRVHFTETAGGAPTPTEVVAMLITQQASFEEGIAYAQEQIRGSCTMLVLTEKGLYAARDRLGRTPLILGRRNGTLAVSSETAAFPNLGFEVRRDLGPGEIVYIDPDGEETRRPPGERMQICTFLWVYYGYPASSYEGINVETVRYRCGGFLATNDSVTPDAVAGIPDSGIGHALGYARVKPVPYVRPFVKYTPTWPRSFMPQVQTLRDLVARMKLIPIRALIENQRLLFCDDSIVRGTQLKDTVQLLYGAGAREVHMRIACPSLIHPCEFLNFSTSRSTLDLAGRKAIAQLEPENGDRHLDEYATAGSQRQRALVEAIRRHLHLTSLAYQDMDRLVTAVGLPKEKLCTHCWDGSSYD